MNAWGRIKCWLRGHHDWKLHWSPREHAHPRDHAQWVLVGSECLGCGKHRAA